LLIFGGQEEMASERQGAVRIGTSGWVYKHWRGTFYPAEMPVREWFSYYAARFETVEVNNSFYRLPSEEAVRQWARQAPPGFLYALKASRWLTHRKKLKDPEAGLELLFERAHELGAHLGPVLYQLPPRWHRNVDRLRDFLAALPVGPAHVFEFRDPSWYDDEVRRVLESAGAGFCMHDLRGVVSPLWITARVVYIRFHGPGQTAYAGGYSREHLERWAGRIAGYRQAGHDVYAYFNNDDQAHAVRNALELRGLLEESIAGQPARR
jgi:uncharacterized protein YecE (DUF72 family)